MPVRDIYSCRVNSQGCLTLKLGGNQSLFWMTKSTSGRSSGKASSQQGQNLLVPEIEISKAWKLADDIDLIVKYLHLQQVFMRCSLIPSSTMHIKQRCAFHRSSQASMPLLTFWWCATDCWQNSRQQCITGMLSSRDKGHRGTPMRPSKDFSVQSKHVSL